MRGSRFVAALLLAAAVAAACEKAAQRQPGKTNPGLPETPADTIATDTAGRERVYISVAQAFVYGDRMAEGDGSEVLTADGIVGYIVGDVNGISLGSAELAPPFNSESNILIADNPIEGDVGNCMPVQLKAGTDFRAELNLKAHPENYGRKLVVMGTITNYFKTYGVCSLTGYEWLAEETQNNQADRLPVISATPQLIRGGR